MRVYFCLTQEHNLYLVAFAALICVFGSCTVMSLTQRAVAASGSGRLAWLTIGATSSGGAIWALHFVAMLAYDPGLPTYFEVGLTALSIVVAISVTGIGLAIAVFAAGAPWRWLGGAVVGMGVASMHYTGMAAMRVPALVGWDWSIVAISLLLAVAACAPALGIGLQRDDLRHRSLGALLLVFGICSLHFAAMGALELTPSPLVPLPEEGLIPPVLLALAVGGVALAQLSFCLAGSLVDQHLANRSVREARRLQDLANATFEGIAIHSGGRLIDGNGALADLLGDRLPNMIGREISDFVAPEDRSRGASQLTTGTNGHYEIQLLHSDGNRIPVEVLGREMDYKGRRVRVAAVRDMRERKAAEEQIRFMATHDALTGLPNRFLFGDRLEQALGRARRAGEQLALLCLDLDRFKEVNDLRGHGAGDALLKQVGARLAHTIRETDTAARLGGDEFGIVQCGLSQPEGAASLADRILASMQEPFDLDGEGMAGGVSIGIALFPADGRDAATLLRNADTSLYRAKADGRGVYRMFEPAMDARLQARRTLEYDLRQALAQQQFELYYQPQAESRGLQVTGFEALLRWHHPRHGMVTPDDFIPLAEESGLIVPLGEWVLRTACAAAADWPSPIRVSVNLSPTQFIRGGLPQLVAEILGEHRLDPDRLELEITEGVLIKNSEQALQTLHELKALGIHIAMDDFGTGYSSLSYLQRFPFDKIKIDKSFIQALERDGDAAAIVRAVIGLGRSLKLPVIAEGVETARQLEILQLECCEEIQGYLIGRPMPLEQCASFFPRATPAVAARKARSRGHADRLPERSTGLVLAREGP